MQTIAVHGKGVTRNLVTHLLSECAPSATASQASTASLSSGSGAPTMLTTRLFSQFFTNLRLRSTAAAAAAASATASSSDTSTSQPSQTASSAASSSSSTASQANSPNSNTSSNAQSSSSSSNTGGNNSQGANANKNNTVTKQKSASVKNLRLRTAQAGFSKDLNKPLTKLGQVGDDAWFISSQRNVDVLGVADGVGGWREYGVDPSRFSCSLMETCKRLVENERLNLNEVTRLSPVKILSRAYNELLDDKNGLIGSSTACIVVFNRDASLVHAANLGDSGFVIIRDNKIIHRSQEQQHYFNSPYQLAIHPNLHLSDNNEDSLISDQPESASTSSFKVDEGDFIVVATDGLWDNLSESDLISEVAKIKSFLLEDLEKAAKSIARKAIELAFDPDYLSPFAVSARKNIGVNVIGGKPDDVTVLLARVSR